MKSGHEDSLKRMGGKREEVSTNQRSSENLLGNDILIPNLGSKLSQLPSRLTKQNGQICQIQADITAEQFKEQIESHNPKSENTQQRELSKPFPNQFLVFTTRIDRS